MTGLVPVQYSLYCTGLKLTSYIVFTNDQTLPRNTVHTPGDASFISTGIMHTRGCINEYSLHMVAGSVVKCPLNDCVSKAVNINAGIQGCEVLHEAQKVVVRMAAVVHAAHLSYGVHRQLKRRAKGIRDPDGVSCERR